MKRGEKGEEIEEGGKRGFYLSEKMKGKRKRKGRERGRLDYEGKKERESDAGEDWKEETTQMRE